MNGDGLAAVYVKQAGQADQQYFAHTDHLGSILSLTDANGTAVFRATYDAWGKQTVSLNTIGFHRGYTGHEHLPEFSLTNMNGRLYDPVAGRFLSPDNYIQLPDFTQSFNRYSYALNNPLVYNDQDGEFFWAPIIVFAAWSGMLNVTMHSQDINNFWQGLGYFGIGAGSAILGGVAGQAASIATSFGSGALIGGAGAFGSSLIASGGNALLSGSGFNLNSSLIAGGIGAFTGGLAGAANAHMANLESNNLLAYGYTVDVNNGTIQLAPGELGELGGKDVNFYNIGYYTDVGSAFVQLEQEVVQGANTINAFRFWQSAASTVAAFSVPASGLTGFFMEPNGPDSNVEGSGLRIPEGQYDVTRHWRTVHYGRYSLQNPSLLGNRNGILMHYGKSSVWTAGCLLPACSWSSNNTISGSLEKLNALQLQIDKAKSMKINIFNVFY